MLKTLRARIINGIIRTARSRRKIKTLINIGGDAVLRIVRTGRINALIKAGIIR